MVNEQAIIIFNEHCQIYDRASVDMYIKDYMSSIHIYSVAYSLLCNVDILSYPVGTEFGVGVQQ